MKDINILEIRVILILIKKLIYFIQEMILSCYRKNPHPSMNPRGIDFAIKAAADKCGIDKKKAHCHAFRHFFAKMFLKKTKDVVQLADLLGHGSVDTTRIYLQKSFTEQKREVNRVVSW